MKKIIEIRTEIKEVEKETKNRFFEKAIKLTNLSPYTHWDDYC